MKNILQFIFLFALPFNLFASTEYLNVCFKNEATAGKALVKTKFVLIPPDKAIQDGLCIDYLVDQNRVKLLNKYLLAHFNDKFSMTREASKQCRLELLKVTKYNGKVKKKYYGYTICTIVNEMEITQKPENKRILKRMIEIAYEAYQSRYRKQFKGIELDIDPITCDIITDAVYIKIDWDNNCKIVYSLDTLTKCIATNRKYIGYDIDERGNTFYVYKDEPLGYYISPYTKMKFYKYDIIKVNTKMLKS